MRPTATISEEFLDVVDDLGEPLPLMEAWLDFDDGERPLADCTLLLVQHQLANQGAQAEALVRLGARPERIHWVDIPYTSHERVRTYVSRELQVPLDNFVVSTDYRVLDSYASYQHRRVVQSLLRVANQSEGPLIVLDDGAYVLEALSSLRRERWPRQVAIVEQTTRGVIKINESHALRRVAESVPFVNVAQSTPKRTLEPPFIGMSVCASLSRKLQQRLAGRPLDRCLVLGYGAIGEQVASFLVGQFAVGRRDVVVFDEIAARNELAKRRGFAIWQRDSDQLFDLVIGCSGRASFAIGDFPFLEDGALLASASSGAVELSRGAFIELADASGDDDIRIVREHLDETNLHADLELELVDRNVVFLNGGFPVNFDGRIATTPARFIQPTPVMMCAAAAEAHRALRDGRRGIIDLPESFSSWIDASFRDVLGSDVHLLLPPPDEAW